MGTKLLGRSLYSLKYCLELIIKILRIFFFVFVRFFIEWEWVCCAVTSRENSSKTALKRYQRDLCYITLWGASNLKSVAVWFTEKMFIIASLVKASPANRDHSPPCVCQVAGQANFSLRFLPSTFSIPGQSRWADIWSQILYNHSITFISPAKFSPPVFVSIY